MARVARRARGRAPRDARGDGRAAFWISAERLPEARAVWPELSLRAPIEAPPRSAAVEWDAGDALAALLRGRLEGLGPVTIPAVALELRLEPRRVEAAMIALETEGTVLRGRFSPRGARFRRRRGRPLLGRRRDRVVPSTAPRSHPPLHDRPAARGDRAREPGRFHALPSLPLAASRPRRAALRRTRSPGSRRAAPGVRRAASTWESDILPARIEGYDARSGSTPCRCRARSRGPAPPPSAGADRPAAARAGSPLSLFVRADCLRGLRSPPIPISMRLPSATTRARHSSRCGRADRRSSRTSSRARACCPSRSRGARRARFVGSRHCGRDGRPQGLDRARERAPRE